MNSILNLLFPYRPTSKTHALLLLVLRLLLGGLFLKHGLDKLYAFEELQHAFPDPLGISSKSSLILAIFGELVCSIGFILGFFYRLSLIPMITTMGVAYFIVHATDPFATKELAFVYLALFLILIVAGPGRYSIDGLIGKTLNKRKRNVRIRKPLI